MEVEPSRKQFMNPKRLYTIILEANLYNNNETIDLALRNYLISVPKIVFHATIEMCPLRNDLISDPFP